MIIKSIKLNRYNDKLLGAAVFLGGDLIAPFVTANDTHINVAIEDIDGGILIKPIKALEFVEREVQKIVEERKVTQEKNKE